MLAIKFPSLPPFFFFPSPSTIWLVLILVCCFVFVVPVPSFFERLLLRGDSAAHKDQISSILEEFHSTRRRMQRMQRMRGKNQLAKMNKNAKKETFGKADFCFRHISLFFIVCEAILFGSVQMDSQRSHYTKLERYRC
jgi:hypothetical protein